MRMLQKMLKVWLENLAVSLVPCMQDVQWLFFVNCFYSIYLWQWSQLFSFWDGVDYPNDSTEKGFHLLEMLIFMWTLWKIQQKMSFFSSQRLWRGICGLYRRRRFPWRIERLKHELLIFVLGCGWLPYWFNRKEVSFALKDSKEVYVDSTEVEDSYERLWRGICGLCRRWRFPWRIETLKHELLIFVLGWGWLP